MFLKSQISLALGEQDNAEKLLAQSAELRRSLVPAQDYETVATLKQEHFDQLISASLLYVGLF